MMLIFTALFCAFIGGIAAQNQCLIERFGDLGGAYFDDLSLYMDNGNLTGVRVYHREYIHGVQFRYGNTWSAVHGDYSNTGAFNEFTLSGGPGDAITSVAIRHGIYIDQIAFNLNDGKTYGPYGGWGGDLTQRSVVCGHSFFKGYAGSYLNQLSLFVDCTWCP